MDYREKHGGIGVHHSQRDISYQLIANGMPDKEVIELLMTATFALPEAIKWDRKEELRRITKLCRGAHARLAREESEAIEMPSPDGRTMLSIEEFRSRQRKGIRQHILAKAVMRDTTSNISPEDKIDEVPGIRPQVHLLRGPVGSGKTEDMIDLGGEQQHEKGGQISRSRRGTISMLL